MKATHGFASFGQGWISLVTEAGSLAQQSSYVDPVSIAARAGAEGGPTLQSVISPAQAAASMQVPWTKILVGGGLVAGALVLLKGFSRPKPSASSPGGAS